MPRSRPLAPERSVSFLVGLRPRLLLVAALLLPCVVAVPERGWAQAPVSQPEPAEPPEPEPAAPPEPQPAAPLPSAAPAPSQSAAAEVESASPVSPDDAGGAERDGGGGGARGRRSQQAEEPADADDGEGTAPFRVGGRLMLGFEHESERSAGTQPPEDSSEYGFMARQIRLRLKGELAGLFRANLSFDLSDAFDPEAPDEYDQPPYLRNAFIEYRPSKAFRVRVGRFKRAFSHLELESASDLPILRRGLFNDELIEDSEWGDRALGVRFAGRLKAPRLRWYLSVTNPRWSTRLDPQGLDVSGRAEWTLVKGLVVGANAAHKSIRVRGGETVTGVAYGGDVSVEVGGAHFLLESNSAPSTPAYEQRALGALFMFHYDWALDAVWTLQPVAFAEYADADDQVLENESLRLVFGVNALGYDGFRIMPQVDIVRSIGDTSADNPWLESETISLIFSLLL